MYTVAIVSCAGGVGRTTVTANLASMIARRGRAVLALDFDPQNALGLYLGLPSNEADGLALRMVSGGRWSEAAYQNSDKVRFLPYGTVKDAERIMFEQALTASPGWLPARLGEVDLPGDTVIVCDTARLPSAAARTVAETADLVLGVILADTSSYARLTFLRELSGTPKPVHYVLNRFDATRRLQNDLVALLRTELGPALVPYLIHRDESVPEAIASNRSLADQSPNSQAAHDLQGLASWVLGRAKQAGVT